MWVGGRAALGERARGSPRASRPSCRSSPCFRAAASPTASISPSSHSTSGGPGSSSSLSPSPAPAPAPAPAAPPAPPLPARPAPIASGERSPASWGGGLGARGGGLENRPSLG